MYINKIIVIILISLSLIYSRERDNRDRGGPNLELENLLIRGKWDAVPLFIGYFKLNNPDKELPILDPIGNKNGKSLSTLNAVLEFLKTDEKCYKIDSICYDTYGQEIKGTPILKETPETSYVNYQLKLQYHTELFYSWIGSGKPYKKGELSRSLQDKINKIRSARKIRYQDLIKNPVVESKLPDKNLKKDTTDKLKEAEIYVLSRDIYKKLRVECEIVNALRKKSTSESRIEKELEYSERYKIPPDPNKLSEMMQLIIDSDIVIEQKLFLYKLKTGVDFDTSIVNISNFDCKRKSASLKASLIKEFMEPKISKESEIDIGW